MSEAPRLTTVRVGRVCIDASETRHLFDARIVRDAEGAYRSVFAGHLSEPFVTLEQAVRNVETPKPVPSDVSCHAEWREDLAPLPDEQTCPLCSAPVQTSARYPRKLCPACVLEATCAQGRRVQFFNTSFGSGSAGRYIDDETPYAGKQCFVRDVECRVDEHRLGGIVVQAVHGCRGNRR